MAPLRRDDICLCTLARPPVAIPGGPPSLRRGQRPWHGCLCLRSCFPHGDPREHQLGYILCHNTGPALRVESRDSRPPPTAGHDLVGRQSGPMNPKDPQHRCWRPWGHTDGLHRIQGQTRESAVEVHPEHVCKTTASSTASRFACSRASFCLSMISRNLPTISCNRSSLFFIAFISYSM